MGFFQKIEFDAWLMSSTIGANPRLSLRPIVWQAKCPKFNVTFNLTFNVCPGGVNCSYIRQLTQATPTYLGLLARMRRSQLPCAPGSCTAVTVTNWICWIMAEMINEKKEKKFEGEKKTVGYRLNVLYQKIKLL